MGSRKMEDAMIDNDPNRTCLRERTSITHEVGVRLPTDVADFRLHLYEDEKGKQHLALVLGDVSGKEDVMTRIHSECLTGDLFGSLRCDCQSQLHQAMEMIAEEGMGILIYLRQEGRGIGLLSKLHSYNLQDEGLDTVDANTALGYLPDAREYDVAFMILKDLGVRSIRLLSNNPDKFRSFDKCGVGVTSMISINPRVTKDNIKYLETKAERFHHLIDIEANSYHSPEIEKLLRFVNRAIAPNGSGGPLITLFFDQTLNGQMADSRLARPPEISKELTALKYRLRTKHQAVLTDARSLAPDAPHLDDAGPLMVIWDPDLRRLERWDLATLPSNVLVLAEADADKERVDLVKRSGINIAILSGEGGPESILAVLRAQGISSIIVEGPPEVLRSILFNGSVRLMIGLVGPCISENAASVDQPRDHGDRYLDFKEMNYLKIGSSLIYYGTPVRGKEGQDLV
jgi:GTP cyclohydrolase II